MFKITIYHICLIAIFTALVVAVKYFFGFIIGFELVTLLIVIYALFLPLHISSLICGAFITLTGVIYGFGPWLVVYVPIFFSDVFLSWTLKKFIKKNNFIFGLWCALLSFNILFWYSASDYIMFGQAKALSQILTGWWVNLIGAAGNLIVGLAIFEPVKTIFKKFYNKEKNRKY